MPAKKTQVQKKKPKAEKGELVRTSNNSLTRKGAQGFQTYFTDELGEEIVESIREGMPVTLAGHLHRVPQSTLSTWLGHGEANPEEKWGAFTAAVRQAQAEFVLRQIQRIDKAGMQPQQWTAAMTLLERMHPEFFRRPDSAANVNVNVAVGVVDRRLHELHEAGEIVYDGG